MELLAPAGNTEKLKYAYAYGADAAYIGLKRFSLRLKADNFYGSEDEAVQNIRKAYPSKKLYCALNISFHNRDLDSLIADIDFFKRYPIDAFIVQDLGVIGILQKHFPDTALHLSTQANCINREAVRLYQSLGFSRIVLGRETSLKEIREIKDAVPDMELEAFVHGAMCIAYSGRCLMSTYMSGRSANAGACSHSCRWDYKLTARADRYASDPKIAEAINTLAESGVLSLTEKKRDGESFPIYEGGDFTALLSSKDLCMIEHLSDLQKAGVDSLKIEGRMKSVYYAAVVTRAYRKALDALEGRMSDEEAAPFVEELYKVSSRELGTGFYYGPADANKTVRGASESDYDLAAIVGSLLEEKACNELFSRAAELEKAREAELFALHPNARAARERDLALHPEKEPPLVSRSAGRFLYQFSALNKISAGTMIEYVSPDIPFMPISGTEYRFVNPDTGELMPWVSQGHPCLIQTDLPLAEGGLIRIKTRSDPSPR